MSRLLSLLAFSIVLILSACSDKNKIPENNPAFTEYITSHTAGMISAQSSIQIVLQNEINANVESGTPIEVEPFSFDPDIDGKTVWMDSRTLVFQPDEALPQGESYRATFNLGALIDLPSELDKFEFLFQTITQDYRLLTYRLEPVDRNDLVWNTLTGSISSADVARIENLKKDLEWEGIDAEDVEWRSEDNGLRHVFEIDSVRRKDEEYNLALKANDEYSANLKIPSLRDFSVLNVYVEQVPAQKVSISFSDPIAASQSTVGLFRLGNADVASVEIDGSVVHLFPANRLSGNHKLEIAEGLKNILGYPLKKKYEQLIAFDMRKPEIRFTDEGVVMPLTGPVHIPFEAVGLRAVDVRIYKIFASNIHQFLQVNDLSGEDELRRVARPVHQQRITLQGNNINFSEWTTFSMDIDKMIRRDPGAIYHIELSFRKGYSAFYCGEGDNGELPVEEDVNLPESLDPDVFSSYYYYPYYSEGYDYRERENPCHISYYTSNRFIEKNILATDLALIAKGNDGKFSVYVNNLVTGEAISSADVELLNYQGQAFASAQTDRNGKAAFETDGVPFVVIAKKGDQRAFLKMETGQSLSLSNFDVGGSDVRLGTLAYLYAERGVWRPGDTVFLNAVINDKDNPLPVNHPIVLTVKDPMGKEVYRSVARRGDKVIYPFPFTTDKKAITGLYTAALEVGGRRFTKGISIETIMPNRLDIQVRTPGGRVLNPSQPQIELESKWLTGAPAAMSPYQVELRLEVNPEPFEGFEGYSFIDMTRIQSHSSGLPDVEGSLDVNGKAVFSPQLGSLDQSAGLLNMTVGTRVYEPGGRFSINRKVLPLAPFNHLVGLKLPEPNRYGYYETGKVHNIQLARVNADGSPVNGKVRVSVYKVDWSWWWSARRGRAAYFNKSGSTLLEEQVVDINRGRGSFNLNIQDDQWGRLYIQVEDENGRHRASQIAYLDWGWGRDRSGRAGGESAQMLNIQTDKPKYAVGDNAVITIPTGGVGRVLVSVENGRGQMQDQWLDAAKGNTVFNLKITEDMAPNVYINAMLIQPHAQSVNDLPLRLYGFVPLMVENPETHLAPALKVADEIRPNTEFEVEVSEENGRAMSYTLAVVDEGLLGLTSYKTKDPWDVFYAKQALGVRTWDIYDMVINAFGGGIAQILAVGGDAMLLPSAEREANRFTPVVRFLGPFKLNTGKRNRHSIRIGNYMGAVRVMIVSANDEEAYGAVEKRVSVRQPLMVQFTMPRVLGPGDKVSVPVTVFSNISGSAEFNLKVTSDGPLSMKNSSLKVSFDGPGQQTVYFDADVAERLGVANIRVQAEGASEKAKDEVEISVRSPMMEQTKEEVFAMTDQRSTTYTATPFGLEGSNNLWVELSTIPDLSLSSRLEYLIGYPHGCTEQIVSKAMPQIFLSKFVEMDADQRDEANRAVSVCLNQLRQRQTASGGFRMWPNNAESSDWVTSYAGHFLVAAEKAGFDIPSGMKDSWLRYQSRMAHNWQSGDPGTSHAQAYRLYVLALAGEAEKGAMNRLRGKSNLSAPTVYNLAAAYAVVGESRMARELLNKPNLTVGTESYYYTYGSSARNRAMHIEALLHTGNSAEAMRLALELAKEIGSSQWMSTQTLGYSLMVLSEVFSGGQSGIHASVQIGNRDFNVNTNKAVARFDADQFHNATPVVVEKSDDTPIFVRILRSGIPRYGEEVGYNKRVNMEVKYSDKSGKVLDVSRLKIGSTIVAEVRITGTAGINNTQMALTQIFPGGWEISNTRLLLGDQSTVPEIRYQDIRDDRVMHYFDLYGNNSIVIRMELKASYPGRWYLPPAHLEAMYDAGIGASNTGEWVEVTTE